MTKVFRLEIKEYYLIHGHLTHHRIGSNSTTIKEILTVEMVRIGLEYL